MPYAEKRSNGRWRGGYRDGEGKQRWTPAIYLNKTAALRGAGRAEEEQQSGRRPVGELSAHTTTWGQWQPRWQSVRRVSEATRKVDATTIAKHLVPRWGDVLLSDINRHDVQAWVNELAKVVAPGTVAKIYYLLSSSLEAAVEAEVLDRHPTLRRIELPEPTPGHERYLEVEEVAATIAELDEPYRSAVMVMVGTGMRFGEMAGLHWQRVDLERGTVEVIETWSRHSRRITRLPKGGRQRVVPIPAWVRPYLGTDRGRARCGLSHDEFGVECRSGLVIPSPTGKALDSKNMLNRHFRPAMVRAGIDPARQHDLRHTFASWLAQGGTSIDTLADLLGHVSTRTTKRYRHLNPGYLDAPRGVLEDRFTPRSDPAPEGNVPPDVPGRRLKIVRERP